MNNSARSRSACRPAKQLDDRRLHGHIECGGDLVTDEQPGGHHQRPGDSHPLAFAAGELVRIAIAEVGTQRDVLQDLGHPVVTLRARHRPREVGQRLLDDGTDRLARLSAVYGVLEDVLHRL